jgi:hypothetical protein
MSGSNIQMDIQTKTQMRLFYTTAQMSNCFEKIDGCQIKSVFAF